VSRPARRVGPALLGLALLALAACIQPAARPEDGPAPVVQPPPQAGIPLIVASDLDNMPFAGLDEQGRPIGRDVEMMVAIGEAIGRPVRWHRADFETLLPSAQAGFPDVVCATLGITPERAEKVAFTRPYFETVITVVVRSGEGEPRGWDDLDHLRVAAGKGTTAERAVAAKLPKAQLVTESKAGLAAAERLLLGEVDGIAMDGPAADALVARSGGALTTLHTPLATERYALALPRDRTELLQLIDATLERFERDGLLQRWDGKWGLRSSGSPSARR